MSKFTPNGRFSPHFAQIRHIFEMIERDGVLLLRFLEAIENEFYFNRKRI